LNGREEVRHNDDNVFDLHLTARVQSHDGVGEMIDEHCGQLFDGVRDVADSNIQ
jgi:hypothetical protein